MKISKATLRKIIKEELMTEFGPATRGNPLPDPGSNWYPFARALDIGVLDLDAIAYDLGFDSFAQMDRSISPQHLYKKSTSSFLKAARDHSLKAEMLSDEEVIDATRLPWNDPRVSESKYKNVYE